MYIALLSILMLSTLVTAWQLLESMHADSVHIAAQEEASFVLKKIEKILQSAESISQPSDTHASTTTLMLYTKDSDLVTVRLNNASSSIEIRRKDTLFFVPLTTPNVFVYDLQFHYIAPKVGMPPGIRAVLVIHKDTFEIEKYIR